MEVKIFGIPNCGSVKKARTFFEEKGIEYQFHDYKKLGVDEKDLKKWCAEFGWEKVLNRKGLTWRELDETLKNEIVDENTAIKLMKDNTSTIKRPVIQSDKGNTIGFDEDVYQNLFG
ncbi:MAG TPA: Spx/MgsR family RNA polymerase-binding regulatory protein [Pelobium sp.]|nr:Spx/MgsR family RNA polymerase-binding regulatory protein [Pelobium sp.]